MNGFPEALKFVLAAEGGKSNDPADPGGRTAYGITQRTFDEWRTAKKQPTADVWTILPDEVSTIYETRYWRASGADNLDWPLSLVHFDASVNHGVGRAAKFLRAVQWADVPTVDEVFAYLTLRREHILTVGSQRFIRGLLNRVDALLKEAEL